jgi:hypothetical protein
MADEQDSTAHAFEQIQLQEMTASVSETREDSTKIQQSRNFPGSEMNSSAGR